MQAAVASPPSLADLLHDAAAMLHAAGVSTPRLDAEVLLAAALRADRAALYARLRQTVPADVSSTFDALLERRRRREPVAYIVGVREFWSLPIRVTPAVLVPRPETELLVESVVDLARHGGVASVWDVGTGSGCIAVALARELPRARILATDASPAALEVARENAAALGVAPRVDFACADLGEALRAERSFDVVASNPPYLAEGDPVPAELAWEPASALTATMGTLASRCRITLSPLSSVNCRTGTSSGAAGCAPVGEARLAAASASNETKHERTAVSRRRFSRSCSARGRATSGLERLR